MDKQEKSFHKIMAVFYLVIILVFIGFKVYQNSNHGEKTTNQVITSATPESTANTGQK